MKRIYVLNQFALPRTEGGGTRHVDLFGRLISWEPTFVAGDRNHYSQERFETNDRRFHLIRVPSNTGGAVGRIVGWIRFSGKAFFHLASRRQIDGVYGSSPHLFSPLAALLASRLRRVPFVLEVRDLWPESIVAAGLLREESAAHRLLVWLERLLYRSASRIVVVTKGWEDHFTDMGVDLNKVHVIPNGTELSDFQVKQSQHALRSRFGITRFTAVFAGAHGPKDGIDLILDAATEMPHVDFVLVGDGPSKGPAIDRARRQSLTNVRFLDSVPKLELPALLSACDVGIHAVSPLSVFDKGMSPNKLFDYLAAGLPVVSNAREALRDVIVDGECGPIGEAESLADGLQKALDADPSQRTRWSQTGREKVEKEFSRQAAALRLEALLNSIAQDNDEGRR